MSELNWNKGYFIILGVHGNSGSCGIMDIQEKCVV